MLKQWNRLVSEDKQLADELVLELQGACRTVFRGRTEDGAYFVCGLCSKYEFDGLVENAQRIVKAAQEATEKANKPVKTRCAHYPLIRKFYAVAREAGLDTKADGKIRQAFSAYFGFTVWSRADMEATHWELAAAGVRCGELAW